MWKYVCMQESEPDTQQTLIKPWSKAIISRPAYPRKTTWVCLCIPEKYVYQMCVKRKTESRADK